MDSPIYYIGFFLGSEALRPCLGSSKFNEWVTPHVSCMYMLCRFDVSHAASCKKALLSWCLGIGLYLFLDCAVDA